MAGPGPPLLMGGCRVCGGCCGCEAWGGACCCCGCCKCAGGIMPGGACEPGGGAVLSCGGRKPGGGSVGGAKPKGGRGGMNPGGGIPGYPMLRIGNTTLLIWTACKLGHFAALPQGRNGTRHTVKACEVPCKYSHGGGIMYGGGPCCGGPCTCGYMDGYCPGGGMPLLPGGAPGGCSTGACGTSPTLCAFAARPSA